MMPIMAIWALTPRQLRPTASRNIRTQMLRLILNQCNAPHFSPALLYIKINDWPEVKKNQTLSTPYIARMLDGRSCLANSISQGPAVARNVATDRSARTSIARHMPEHSCVT